MWNLQVGEVYNQVQGPYCPKPKTYSSEDEEFNRKEGQAKNEKTASFFYYLRKYYERDSAYLGLIEAFIQDGPQLILQLYILAVRDEGKTGSHNVAVVGRYAILVHNRCTMIDWFHILDPYDDFIQLT